MLRYTSLDCKEYGHIRTWHIYNTGKTMWQQCENNQQILQNNSETQLKHINSLYVGSLCNIALSMARFNCIVTIVIHENLNAMKHIFELCLS